MAEILTQAAAALQNALDSSLTKYLVVATGSAVSLPPSLTDPTKPLVVSGTVIPQPAAQNTNSLTGQPQLSVQTSAGQIVIALNAQPDQTPRGTIAVALQPGNPPTATILAPTNQQATQAAQTPDPVTSQAALNVAAQTVAQTTSVSPLVVGQVVSALVIPAAAGSQAAQGQVIPQAATPVIPIAAVGTGTQAQISSNVILQTAISAAQAGSSGSALIDRRLAAGQLVPPEPDETEDEPSAEADDEPVLLIFATPQQAPAPSSLQTPPQPQTPQPSLAQTPPQTQTLPQTPQPSLAQTSQPSLPQAPDTEDEPASPPAQGSLAASYFPSTQAAPQTQSFVILNIVVPPNGSALEASAAFAARPVASGSQPDEPIETTVIAQTTSGQPVLATQAQQTLVITQPASVALGAQITLRPIATQQPEPMEATAPQPAPALPYNPVPLAAGGRIEWPALAQLVSLLPEAQPQALRALSDLLPRINGDFVERFVAFATAQRPGGFASVPASHLQVDSDRVAPALARTMGGLLSQLHTDLATSARAGSPSKDGHWQTLSVPVMNNERLEAIQMFVRRQIDPEETAGQGQKQGGARQTASTRFLVEVSPSRLGPVQLDGLLRTQRDTTLRLDMVVRPATTLTGQQGQEIDSLFQKALSAAGMSGSLKLQTGSEGFVLPRSDGGGYISQMA